MLNWQNSHSYADIDLSIIVAFQKYSAQWRSHQVFECMNDSRENSGDICDMYGQNIMVNILSVVYSMIAEQTFTMQRSHQSSYET